MRYANSFASQFHNRGPRRGFRLAGEVEFSEAYRLSCQARAEVWADELLDIADNGEHVERDALKIKVRQWLMQKMLPQKYGPSGAGVTQMVQVVIAGDDSNLL